MKATFLILSLLVSTAVLAINPARLVKRQSGDAEIIDPDALAAQQHEVTSHPGETPSTESPPRSPYHPHHRFTPGRFNPFHPFGRPDDDDDDDGPRRRPYFPGGVGPVFVPLDDDDFYGSEEDGPFSYNFLQNMYRDLQRRMRELQAMMNNMFPNNGFGDGGVGGPGGIGGGAAGGPFAGFDDLPPDYDNSTYTTKVINGTLVSINETVKKHESNDSSFYFKVKVINLTPLNETEGGVDSASKPEVAPVDESAPPSSALPSTTASSTEAAKPEEDQSTNDVSLHARTLRRRRRSLEEGGMQEGEGLVLDDLPKDVLVKENPDVELLVEENHVRR